MVNVTANLLGVATLEPCFDSLEMDVETGPVAGYVASKAISGV